MSRNGSGTYSLPSGNPVVSGTTISSTVQNNTMSDIATALTQSIAKDGQTVPTANLPMGGFKHTGLAAGTANGDSVRYEQVALLAGATFTGYINEARGTVTMHATTMDLWAQPNTIDGTGSAVTITAITNAPQAGARRTLYPIAGTIITNGATFVVDGGENYTVVTGDALEFEAVTTSTYKVHITKAVNTVTDKIQSVDYALAANALTLKLNPTSLNFRSTTLTNGAPVTVSNSAQITTTISSGSTGGTISAVQSDIIILAINNAGTMELAWCNGAGGINLDETTLISTTAEGGAGAADSATTIYSTTARTNVAFRVVGLFRSTQTTAGTWAQTPSLVQGYGGQALSVMGTFGFGQTKQQLSGSRAVGTTYYNTTGKPIDVEIFAACGSAGGAIAVSINGGAGSLGAQAYTAGQFSYITFRVLPGNSYAISQGSSGTLTISTWFETR